MKWGITLGFTIATHNGSAVARDHNIRNEKVVSKENHIDPDGIHETWIDERPRQAYDRLFGQAVEDYNNKQTRSDRKITNYYNDICKDAKKHPVYEMIVSIGNRNNAVDAQTGKQILREFVDSWSARNPNLELIGAYYHADEEGVPHVHCDYIPIAHGYTRGMETQTGLVKALGEMGFTKQGKATAQILWEHRENDALETLCKARDLIIEHPLEENLTHLHTDAYKARQELTEVHQEIERCTKKIKSSKEQLQKNTLKASEIVSKAKKQAQAIYDSLIPVKAEYAAKKAYVDAIGKDFDLIGGVEEQKGFFGKPTGQVIVPKKKWETQAVTRMDRDAQLKADKIFADNVKEFKKTGNAKTLVILSDRVKELEQQNAALVIEKRNLIQRLDKAEKEVDRTINKINQTLDRLPDSVSEKFIQEWQRQKKIQNRDMER